MDDDSLHSLLARGGLSGAQRDRILGEVLRAHARPRPTRTPWLVAACALLPAAAVIVLLAWRRPTPEPSAAEYLAPKGGKAGVVLDASCPGRPAGECRVGDRLIFAVGGMKAPAYVAAYADCEARERVWYFPDATGNAPRVAAADEHRVLDRAARIGPEHGVGRCTLHLSLFDRPPERRTALSAAAAASATIPLTILP
jgi:hypothetical protein